MGNMKNKLFENRLRREKLIEKPLNAEASALAVIRGDFDD